MICRKISFHCLAHLTWRAIDILLIQSFLPPIVIVPPDDYPYESLAKHLFFVSLEVDLVLNFCGNNLSEIWAPGSYEIRQNYRYPNRFIITASC